MRFIHVVVSSVGFRDPESNPDRWALLDQLLALAGRRRAQLLVLPGGYLTAHDPPEMRRFIREVGRHVDRTGVAVIGGIDLDRPQTKRTRNEDAAVQNGLLPFYGFATGPLTVQQPRSHPWRQTSTTNRNAGFVADEDLPGAERVVVLRQTKVAVLICGELFSERARTAMSRLGVALAVDLGHSGMGNGLVPAMRRLALDGGCAVAHAQHVGSTTGGIHFVNSTGAQHSVALIANGLLRQGNLWAGWTMRDVGQSRLVKATPFPSNHDRIRAVR